jgi:hypothetical protein
MKQDRRGSWYLLTGLVLGVAAGLVYSWVISPVRYIDAPPSALRADYKDDYRALVAAAYLYSMDLVRAEDRLAQLKDDESAETLAMQAQRALAEGHSEEEIYALNTLADALNGNLVPNIKESTPVPEENLIPVMDKAEPFSFFQNSTPNLNVTTSTLTTLEATTIENIALNIHLMQTSAPFAVSAETFSLVEKRLICNINQLSPLIQVEVLNAEGQPVASVEVVVTWDGGKDHFFTGLQHELGLGYADFTMSPEVSYSVQLAGGDSIESNLSAAECVAEDDNRYWGSWYLIYKRP